MVTNYETEIARQIHVANEARVIRPCNANRTEHADRKQTYASYEQTRPFAVKRKKWYYHYTFLVFFFFCTLLLSSLWTGRGHKCRPFPPPGSCLHFISRIGFSNPTARRFFIECYTTHYQVQQSGTRTEYRYIHRLLCTNIYLMRTFHRDRNSARPHL